MPTDDQQAVYDATQHRVNARRAKFYGQTPFVVPVDPAKLTEEGKAHRARVGKSSDVTPKTHLESMLAQVAKLYRSPRPQLMPYAEARIVVDAIYQAELSRRNRQLLLDTDTDLVIEKLTRYFIGDPGDPERLTPSQYEDDNGALVPVEWIPLHKCLYLYGNVGVGKTFLLDMMSMFSRIAPLVSMQFQKVRSKQILLAVHVAKNMSPIYKLRTGGLLIDDLGEEKRQQNIYGEDEDPMDHLLGARYDDYIATGLKTHFTSNKQPDELEKIYGTRTNDRIREMCEFVWFPGFSKRPDIGASTPYDDDELHDADFPAP